MCECMFVRLKSSYILSMNIHYDYYTHISFAILLSSVIIIG